MVHLASVSAKPDGQADGQPPEESQRRKSTVPGLEHIELEVAGEDEYSTSIYGSRFAAMDLPHHDMPEKEMPKEIAYRMIRDELSLDGSPMLK